MSTSASWDKAPLRSVLARFDVVAARWELDDEERSALLGGFRTGSVSDVASYDTPTAEHRMRLLVALEPILEGVLVDEARICGWLRRPNAHLRKQTPLEVMAQSPEWIRWLIRALGVVA